jgi:hypothetical protein
LIWSGQLIADKKAAMYGSMTPLLTEFLTPDLIGKMGSRAGISDVASVQKTISGAVPAILSGLAHLVSTPREPVNCLL